MELCSNFFTGWDSFWVMPLPLCSLGETRCQLLQGSITDALRRCGSTTWDGNRSAYGHARVWHRSLGTSKTFFLNSFKDRAFLSFSSKRIYLQFFEFPSRTRTCSHQEWLTGRRFRLCFARRLLGGFTRFALQPAPTPGVGDCRFRLWRHAKYFFFRDNRRKKKIFLPHFHAFTRQNQLEKYNDQQLRPNVFDYTCLSNAKF